MVKVRRLVYLPDPTIKFYIEYDDLGYDENEGEAKRYELYCDYDKGVSGLNTKENELVVTNKRKLFSDLRRRFDPEKYYGSYRYEDPYFTNLSNNLSYYEVMTFEE